MSAQEIDLHREAETAPAPASESAAIFSMIERAARDPNVDIEKMERLMQMQERVMERSAKAAYAQALAEMQPELPVIQKRGGIRDRSGNVQSRYALWEDINDAIKPVLAKHGFAISFRVGREEGAITVTGVLSHRDGHSEETTIALPVDTSGSKNAVQAVGSSTSYGKRYTAQALLNLTSRDGGERDDDGRAAGAPEPISQAQLDELRDLIDEVGADTPALCKYLQVNALRDIPAKEFGNVKALVNRKRDKANA